MADLASLWTSPVFLLVLVSTFTMAGLALACWWQPRVFIALFLRPFLHLFYRYRIHGRENLPAQGPALLVCNPVSHLDWLLLLAALRRPLRLVITAPGSRSWGLRSLLKWLQVILLDAASDPRMVARSLHEARQALQAGQLVCVFADGRRAPAGFELPFHQSYEMILEQHSVPVIPVCLDQRWGSVFSFRDGRFRWKWPQDLPSPVTVAFGQPLPPTATAGEVRLAMEKLSADWAIAATEESRPVHRQFVRVAAQHPFRPCFIDTLSGVRVLNYGKVLAGAMCLADQLRPILRNDRMVGVWLPSSVGGAVANIALALLGKTTVNLNYTASPEGIESAIRQCRLRHILTSRKFTDARPLDVDANVQLVNLEDVRQQITPGVLLRAYLKVLLLPRFVLDRFVLGLDRHRLDDLATIIFSSGSTGEPKGIMLTHRNIASNAESMVQAIDLRANDRALGVLPFFHSFGYTVTLWCPLQVGASVVYHPDPRQGRKVGELCRSQRCNIFLGTSTFLSLYLRQCQADDFRSLRLLICGAEKLSQSAAQEFQRKFGIEPLEGYGCTELSPAVASNLPDEGTEVWIRIRNRRGSIGQPLPGLATRIVHPETLAPLPPGHEGLLLVYGANVMKGYLGREDLTRAVLRDGWYITGDMGRIDDDGFITLTGRLSRFAKIGGEMIPLEKVEEQLHAILQSMERLLVVTCVPDPTRGERLIVLYTSLNGHDIRTLCQRLRADGLSNLEVPAERDFFQVPELPLLGSGKVHLQRVKELALEQIQCHVGAAS
jgi:acyl-[acyl-carrier-protein]-phospholipid O-acyltransferase/long-chain-fatty-acid--[acyl-carrier-protein] ligase